jgi:WD40 repeat protein/predicted Ser/Thr protein kinase
MSEQHRLRVRSLFAEAADLPHEQRAAFLEARCGGEATLRAEVEDLLAYDWGLGDGMDGGSFLESPLVRADATTVADASSGSGRREATPPSHIGRYRILGRHGEGGMGIVYEAEQDNPRRTVALKVLRPDFVSAELVSRFKHEAQILARLQHPGIAQVYEAGINDDGRPFFAMEFIRGLPLDEYARARGLQPRACLELVANVCDAVQHAHDRGVVHRDLKPSNILVEESAQPKVLDFGIAHVTTADLMTLSSRTRTGELLGTINYMSPEQVAAHPTELDGRSDVYTLGVILFELLAHRSPYQLDHHAVHEVARAIEHEEPPPLSSIDTRYRGDLEIIVAKALEKDKTRRYASAGALATDIRRHLRGEAIQARQVSTAERYWRWARRNPVIATLGGVLTGVLVLATVSSLLAARLFYAQAQAQHTLADERESARQNALRAGAMEAAARRKADAANTSLRATQEELRGTVYSTRSNLALAAWENHDTGRLRSLLDLLRPAPGELDSRGWEWRFLWQLDHEDRLTLRAQDGIPFSDVAFSPDGRTIASLAGTDRIQLWDRVTGKSRWALAVAIRRFEAPLAGGVHALAFSPDGRRLAGPGPGDSLALYDVDTGELSLGFEGSPGAVLDLAWSPGGHILVAAISGHVMRVWNAQDGHLVHANFGSHNRPVAAVAFSPDGRTIASASYDGTVKLWDPANPAQPRAVLEGHTDEILAVAWSPDGQQLCSAGADRTIRVWDPRSAAPRSVIWGHRASVTSLAYLPDSARVATGSADETVRIWDIATGQELRNFKGHTGDVAGVAVSPDGHDIASAGDTAVKVWDPTSPARPRTLRSPSVLTYGGTVDCVAFSPDGRRLASGHNDRAVRVWDRQSDGPPRLLTGHDMPVKNVAFSPDGRTIASSSQTGLRLWDAATGQPRLTIAHTGAIGGLVFTPDGETVLASGQDHMIHAWDRATGEVRYVLKGHSDMVNDLALSPDGRALASASWDRTCMLWDLAARQPRAILRGHTAGVNTAAFSPDGRSVATASSDTTVRLWDAADGTARGILTGHILRVDGLAFSPDGRLASSAWDKTIRLWDTDSRQTLLILKGHAARIRSIKFSPDGRTLASGSHDRTIKLWEAAPEGALFAP